MNRLRERPRGARPTSVRLALVAMLAGLAALASSARDARAARGGPDAFGYSWRDDREPGVAYQRFDFTSPPTTVFVPEPGADASTAAIPLPFTFSFYGRAYASVALSEDGWLTFLDAGLSDATPSPVPSPDGPRAMIAPLWEDLSLGARGGGDFLRYETDAEKIVFEWFRARVGSTGEDATFQVWLFRDGRIRLQWLNVAGPHPGATVGLEDDTGSVGLAIMTLGTGTDGFTIRAKSAVEILPPSDADCATPVSCPAAVTDSVGRNPDRMQAYGAGASCGAGYAGAEVVRTLTLTDVSHVVATLSQGAASNDLFLLPACTELGCLATGDSIAAEFLPPGDYVLAVDAPAPNAPSFMLNVACAPAFTPASCGSNAGSVPPRSRFASWPCLAGAALAGGETIYRVTLPAGGDLVATLDRADLAVIVTTTAGFPAGATCLSGGWQRAWATDLPPGDYLVVVDAAAGATGPFTLTLDCGGARTQALACGSVVTGSLPATGEMDGWSCAAPLPGGEALHEITLGALATLTIRLDAAAPAQVLLLDGAAEGPASCLAAAPSFISYANAPPGRYVVVVDTESGSDYTLTVDCDEPVSGACTPWEQHDGDVPITGLTTFPTHGDPAFYELATPPPPDDPGWKPAPDPGSIGYARASDICGHACLTAVDFTYFRSYVRLPQTVNSFQLRFGMIDDGVQVRLNGVRVAEGLLGRDRVVDLTTAPSLRPGALNEILLVQMDDCCTWNELTGVACLLSGEDPPCAASLTPPPPVDGLPGDVVTLRPLAADVSNCFDVAEYRWRSGAVVLRDWDPDPQYVHVIGPVPETITVEVRCRRDAACTASGEVPVTVPPCSASVAAPDDVADCPRASVVLTPAPATFTNCFTFVEYRWLSGPAVVRDWDPDPSLAHVVGPAPETLTLQARCATHPSCEASDDVLVSPLGGGVLPLMTPWLRARRDPGEVPVLLWPGATLPALGGHAHVYRTLYPSLAWTRVDAEGAVSEWADPDPRASWLHWYDVRTADLCENESAD